MRTVINLSEREVFKVGPSPVELGEASTLALYERAASLISAGAWSCELSSNRLTWTRGVFSMFGLPDEQVPKRHDVVEMYCEESRDLLERRRAQAIETCSGFSLDANIVRPDGIRRRIRVTAATQASNGRAGVLYGMKQDVTEDHARWEELHKRAECDPLTGVANRACFQRFLDGTEAKYSLDRIGALILFDVDGFKRLNDWWGHAAGDVCLTTFTERLRQAFPSARLMSRIGGDEFAVLLPPVSSPSETEAAVRCAIGKLHSPVAWNGDLLPFAVSVGLAFAGKETDHDPQALFVAADRALYSAKKTPTCVLVRA